MKIFIPTPVRNAKIPLALTARYAGFVSCYRDHDRAAWIQSNEIWKDPA